MIEYIECYCQFETYSSRGCHDWWWVFVTRPGRSEWTLPVRPFGWSCSSLQTFTSITSNYSLYSFFHPPHNENWGASNLPYFWSPSRRLHVMITFNFTIGAALFGTNRMNSLKICRIVIDCTNCSFSWGLGKPSSSQSHIIPYSISLMSFTSTVSAVSFRIELLRRAFWNDVFWRNKSKIMDIIRCYIIIQFTNSLSFIRFNLLTDMRFLSLHHEFAFIVVFILVFILWESFIVTLILSSFIVLLF